MSLGDYLAHKAITIGTGARATIAPQGGIRLTIRFPDGMMQHFERLPTGTCADWRATELEGSTATLIINEPVAEKWGHPLTLITRHVLTR
ncbi:hypothetical protein [Streptomyces noursei]|uniref:hypothetical protein n=1 Tax=Streptomyces noursei TaxID=1971 RepID=UPI001671AE8D|nr:hypothetical protein [Streptomyces noursei]MCZ1019841.1 hypothetical protein [Streptomyces noursei]GGX36302.1 hypothetical protein GCM10010341_67190 [Streptomyces noursei]